MDMKSISNNFKVAAVKALIVQENKYLLALHNHLPPEYTGMRTFLGGHIEDYDPTPEDALRREILEEIKVHIEVHFPLDIFYYHNRSYLVFVASIQGDPVPDPSEILDLGWYTREEIRQMGQRNLLQTGFEEPAIDRYLQSKK